MIFRVGFIKSLAFLSFGLMTLQAFAMPTIMIDPGHEPGHSGATGICQKPEVVYNDEIVRQMIKELHGSYRILITRSFGKPMQVEPAILQKGLASSLKVKANQRSLLARPALANVQQADLFIAIHHDSTLATHQIFDPRLCEGLGGKKLSAAFKSNYKIGYNIFIYDKEQTARKQKSLLLAQAVGAALQKIGRSPSNYHVYPIDSCQSCYPINAALGIWHEDLAVLRNTTMPAILIEVGNIVDVDDEKKINTATFRAQFSLALKHALASYFKP